MPEFFSFDLLYEDFLNIIYIIFVIVSTIVVASVTKKLVNRFFEKSSKYINTDPTQFKFTKHFLSALIYLIGIGMAIYAIPSLRTLSLSIFTGAGIFAAIIGFASQQAFSNIVSGIFIVIFKPFRVDDRLELRGNISGVVEDITLRHTVLKNFENRRVIIPNSIIGQEILYNANITDERTCRLMDFNIAAYADLEKAMAIVEEEALKHPDCMDARKEEDKQNGAPIVPVRVIGFGESSINIRAFVWAKNPPTAFLMQCDLNKSIKLRFDKEGIPFPAYNTTHVKINN